MHDRLGRTDFLDHHVALILREGRPAPRPNRKFKFGIKDGSPIRELARRRFRESIAGMVRGAYRTQYTMPEEDI